MKEIQWGQSLPGLESLNLIDRSCNLSTGFLVCCAIFSDLPRISHKHQIHVETGCLYSRIYIPSPYEEEQFELARLFDGIADNKIRRNKIIEYLVSIENINSSLLWTRRVSDRMKYPVKYGNTVDSRNEIDTFYLSRFNTTRECPNTPTMSWMEWIEPLSLHARHPFSVLRCINDEAKKKIVENPSYGRDIRATSGLSTDHILLYNGRFGKATHGESHTGRNYLFDVGTSTFQSSLWWFTCIFLQRNISFDQIFGWEITLLEPNAFWEEVPSVLRSRYHFYNAPVVANISLGNSPLRIIQQIAQRSDFVAFKLDIDTPEVEIPIALELLENADIRRLVDEFFFELHFRCEIMMYCAWGDRMPPIYLGLNLSRWSTMDFFQRFRRHGIRSHFWP